ncbi:hypothetical protein LCGC14_1604550 [marine sediment metagenome]|uniref:Uncharacterized protein n=1 Tax=marine sediment metagenome TaxID=412755 RepID=A0A0F9IWR7_9ZZZZ
MTNRQITVDYDDLDALDRQASIVINQVATTRASLANLEVELNGYRAQLVEIYSAGVLPPAQEEPETPEDQAAQADRAASDAFHEDAEDAWQKTTIAPEDVQQLNTTGAAGEEDSNGQGDVADHAGEGGAGPEDGETEAGEGTEDPPERS